MPTKTLTQHSDLNMDLLNICPRWARCRHLKTAAASAEFTALGTESLFRPMSNLSCACRRTKAATKEWKFGSMNFDDICQKKCKLRKLRIYISWNNAHMKMWLDWMLATKKRHISLNRYWECGRKVSHRAPHDSGDGVEGQTPVTKLFSNFGNNKKHQKTMFFINVEIRILTFSHWNLLFKCSVWVESFFLCFERVCHVFVISNDDGLPRWPHIHDHRKAVQLQRWHQ